MPVRGICELGHLSFGDGHRLGAFVGRTVYKHFIFFSDSARDARMPLTTLFVRFRSTFYQL